MYNAFRHFDTDNSGYITQQEMEDALTVCLHNQPGACFVINHVTICLQCKHTSDKQPGLHQQYLLLFKAHLLSFRFWSAQECTAFLLSLSLFCRKWLATM